MTASPYRTTRLARAPLVAALALVLGASALPPAATASLADHPGSPRADRVAVPLGGQRDELRGRLSAWRALAAAPSRPAGTVVVANCNDSGEGSLRSALAGAVRGDTIDLTHLACSTITLATGLTTTVDDLTLQGPGAGDLAIDGAGASRVLAHAGYGTLTIDGLTLRNGSYTYGGPGIYGGLAPGACLLSAGSVTMSASVVEDCSASGWSVFGAALDVLGVLHLSDSRVSGVTAMADATEISATIYGGMIYATAAYITGSTIRDATVSATSTSAFSGTMGGGIQGFQGAVLDHSRVSGVAVHVAGAKDSYAKGGGVASPKTVILIASTVTGNSVEGAPGVGPGGPYGTIYTSAIGGGGVYIASVPREGVYASYLRDSTVSGNSARVVGEAGAYTVGGGGGVVSWSPLPLAVTNSTVSGNDSDLQGGGLYSRHKGGFALANATVTDNTAPTGAGIADQGDEFPYPLALDSSIVAGNHLPDGSGSTEITTLHVIGGSHNLVGSANATLPGDTLGGDPLLGVLADNGGPTRTHALLAGSPAIDSGSNPLALAADQRGEGFVREYGTAPDIGAFERQPLPDRIFGDGFDG
jgi:hypothetical protein